jgi:flagellar biosynthetic protein FlhB
MLIIGVADYMYQRWQYTQDLKMTRHEVTDERKSMEGDPEIKARRFRMARQMALQRVNQAVPKADVIVTNPTHFSVALRYDAETMAAPRVVAKGVDFLAMRIRQIAMTHGVPIVERPPLARALYYGVEVGRDVPAEHYQAVAELLAYVYRLDESNRPRLTPPNAQTPESIAAAG